MGLCENIKKSRLKKKLTQTEVASRIPISQSNYSKIELGMIVPDAITLKRICEILQVSSDYLLEVQLKKELLLSDYDYIYKAYFMLQKIIDK